MRIELQRILVSGKGLLGPLEMTIRDAFESPKTRISWAGFQIHLALFNRPLKLSSPNGANDG